MSAHCHAREIPSFLPEHQLLDMLARTGLRHLRYFVVVGEERQHFD
jgi:hypothetical protein